MKTVLFACLLFLSILLVPKITFAYTTNMSASVVVGQSDFSGWFSSGYSERDIDYPNGIATFGNYMAIADTGNNRVLIWNSIPKTNKAPADVVIGQTNFTNHDSNQGGSAAANTLNNPHDVTFASGKLLIADTSNHRVLIYNQIPSKNNASADVVIGQANFTSSSSSCTRNNFDYPYSVDFDVQSGKLAVGETGNLRVSIFNSIPITNGAPVDVSIGNYVTNYSCVGNQDPEVGTNLFSSISGVLFVDSKLIVASDSSNRVAIFNTIPKQNIKLADFYIGQPNIDEDSANQGDSVGPNTLSAPRDIAWDGKRIFVLDYGNSRVLVFNGIPQASNVSASEVIGQKDFVSNSEWQGLDDLTAFALGKDNFRGAGLYATDNQLFVSDRDNDRVLIFDNVIKSPKLIIDNKIGFGTDGKSRLSGRATVDSPYNLKKIECSVNESTFRGATAVDGSIHSSAENFYCDFDKKDNGNKLDGFTMRIRSQNTNLDDTDSAFFFEPFAVVSPKVGEQITTTLPTFIFSVNKQRTRMRDYLRKYQVQIAKEGTSDWKVLIDDIPVDFESVRNSATNLQKLKFRNTSNNGIYENAHFKAEYLQESSSIAVTVKNTKNHKFPFGTKLDLGSYMFKIVAIDRVGGFQETEKRSFKVVKTSTTATSATNTQLLGAKTQNKTASDALGHPLPSPAPSPAPKVQIQDEQNSNSKTCIMFVCF